MSADSGFCLDLLRASLGSAFAESFSFFFTELSFCFSRQRPTLKGLRKPSAAQVGAT